jgi:hypothetical protein
MPSAALEEDPDECEVDMLGLAPAKEFDASEFDDEEVEE